MKFPVPRPVFPRFQFSKKDEHDAVSLVDALIDKLMEDEQAFFGYQGGVVDLAKWKQLGQSEGVFVFAEREAAAVDSEVQQAVPPLLVLGTIRGLLDDVLYNFTTPTRESTFINDDVVDAEVLHQIYGPTEMEPFSHLTIKWVVMPSLFRVIRPRDYVVIDSIDTRLMPNGERIGYRVIHSIELPGTPSLEKQGIVRSNFSITTVFRQTGPDEVHMYGRVFADPGGDIPKSVFVVVGAAQVTATAAAMRNEQKKKLALALRRSEQDTWVVAIPCVTDSQTCGVCLKKLNVLNKSRAQCVLCARHLCRSCRVPKQLWYLNADCTAVKVMRTFCCYCVQQANSVPSAVAATAEFLSNQKDFYLPPAHAAQGRSGLVRKLSQVIDIS